MPVPCSDELYEARRRLEVLTGMVGKVRRPAAALARGHGQTSQVDARRRLDVLESQLAHLRDGAAHGG